MSSDLDHSTTSLQKNGASIVEVSPFSRKEDLEIDIIHVSKRV